MHNKIMTKNSVNIIIKTNSQKNLYTLKELINIKYNI